MNKAIRAVILVFIGMLVVGTIGIVSGEQYTGAAESTENIVVTISDQDYIALQSDIVLTSYAFEYYVPADLITLNLQTNSPSYENTYLHLVATENGTIVNVDTNCDGVPEANYSLNKSQCAVYTNPPAGTHVTSNNLLYVILEFDSEAENTVTQLKPVSYWGSDYWFTGGYVANEDHHYIAFVASHNGTTVNIDTNGDDVPDQTYSLNKCETNVSIDPPAGTHVTSNKPIGILAFYSSTWWFATATELPTAKLDYWFNTKTTGGYYAWLEAIRFTAAENSTNVSVDKNADGIVDATYTLNKSQTAAHFITNQHAAFHVWGDKPIALTVDLDRHADHCQFSPVLVTDAWLAMGGNYGYLSITSTANGTNVSIDTNGDDIADIAALLNKSDTVRYNLPCGSHVWSNNPISMSLEFWGNRYSDDTADWAVTEIGYKAVMISANVTIKPETLNLASKGLFTAFITLPEPYNITDIDISTVVCEDAPAVKGIVADDNKYIAKFNVQDLVGVDLGDAVTLTVTGKLYDGTPFEGSDTIRVIDKGKGK